MNQDKGDGNKVKFQEVSEAYEVFIVYNLIFNKINFIFKKFSIWYIGTRR
jgi:hypothetical protein